MNRERYFLISGKTKDGIRIESRVLEDYIQKAVSNGHRHIRVKAFGQHGIGGRLWREDLDETVHIIIEGQSGQRAGSLGFPGTYLEIDGPASDDVGWLNAGAQIVVRGNASNGVANAMAQGKIYIAGNIGARGMTMTKRNPRFDPPEVWVLGSAGDYFGEFMAGGIAVICGHKPQAPENILGYRPLVGMVGGKVFFRGPHSGYSNADAKILDINDEQWSWLTDNLKIFLDKIEKPYLWDRFCDRRKWQLLSARSTTDRYIVKDKPMSAFRREVWNAELGKGGLIGDLTNIDRSIIPVIATGKMRRFIPKWENGVYLPPCQASCPTGIPVQQRWRLIREGLVDEAVNFALSYTPFPATVCGYLCPNLCMDSCTRIMAGMPSVDTRKLGQASLNAEIEMPPMKTGRKIAVLGGGPAGISVAWQLRMKGHEPVIYDTCEELGGKLTSLIPESRIPEPVLALELERIKKHISHVCLKQSLKKEDMLQLHDNNDFIVIATGANKPRILPVPGKERMISSVDFLSMSKTGMINPGKQVVIIGAGNVGCDVATEAHRLGADKITLIDVQEPASFGREREEAEAIGAVFRWPVYTKAIIAGGVELNTGEVIPADTVVISIGDMPDLDFLPDNIATENGYIKVDRHYRTSDPKIFAIGDVTGPGLLTDSIGAGRKAANAMNDILDGRRPSTDSRQMIDKGRVSLEYFDPGIKIFENIKDCGTQCSSCGSCRDCGLCITICPQNAISRQDNKNGENGYEYSEDPDSCIGCGFCVQACPCGVWNLIENDEQI